MVWKLREGKVPSKQWMADLLAYLERAHGILPTREVVEKLYALIVQQWREGATAREVGKATCSCQKGQIAPSPAALVQLKRGELKPPRSAKRGDLFGFEELRARKIREKEDAAKVKTTSAQSKRALSALPARPSLPARASLPAPSAMPAMPALPARKLRTPKKGPIVKTQTSPAAAARKSAFTANLMRQLTMSQIEQLFLVSQIEKLRQRDSASPTAKEWAKAFMEKMNREVLNARCG